MGEWVRVLNRGIRRTVPSSFSTRILLPILAVLSWRAGCEKCPLDLLVIFDGSGSIGKAGFVDLKFFLKQLVVRFDMDATQIGLWQFSGNVTLSSTGQMIHYYKHKDIGDDCGHECLQKSIINAQYMQGRTFTGTVLNEARLEGFAEARDKSSRMILILTDGLSNDPGKGRLPSKTALVQAEKLKEAGVLMISIGVQVYQKQNNRQQDAVNEIKTLGYNGYYFVSDFETLLEDTLFYAIMNNIVKGCNDPTFEGCGIFSANGTSEVDSALCTVTVPPNVTPPPAEATIINVGVGDGEGDDDDDDDEGGWPRWLCYVLGSLAAVAILGFLAKCYHKQQRNKRHAHSKGKTKPKPKSKPKPIPKPKSKAKEKPKPKKQPKEKVPKGKKDPVKKSPSGKVKNIPSEVKEKPDKVPSKSKDKSKKKKKQKVEKFRKKTPPADVHSGDTSSSSEGFGNRAEETQSDAEGGPYKVGSKTSKNMHPGNTSSSTDDDGKASKKAQSQGEGGLYNLHSKTSKTMPPDDTGSSSDGDGKGSKKTPSQGEGGLYNLHSKNSKNLSPDDTGSSSEGGDFDSFRKGPKETTEHQMGSEEETEPESESEEESEKDKGPVEEEKEIDIVGGPKPIPARLAPSSPDRKKWRDEYFFTSSTKL